MGMNPEITLVTPERAPLAIFGPRAVEVVTAELERAGVKVELGAYAELESGPPRAIVMRPSGRRLEVNRILALPRLRGRTPAGVPADPDGFISVDAHGRVAGLDGVWAAGDGIDFPVKFGGLAAEQADAAAADIAADAGAVVERKPFRPVLRGRLLTSSGPRYMRYDAGGRRRRGRGHDPHPVVAARQDQRPLPDAVARRARRGDHRRPPPAVRWPGRPDRPAPRDLRVLDRALV